MKKILVKLLREQSYRKGEFLLSSGKESEHYINCKPVILSAEGLDLTSHTMLEYIESDAVAVAGLTLGADPLVCGVSLASLKSPWAPTVDALIVRKKAKGHGTGAWIEGPLPPKGSKITVLEDVITTGGSALFAVDKLRDAGYVIERIVCIVNRMDPDFQENLDNAGIELKSILTLDDIVDK
tara:strand:- start:4238 stop:4783 length:546 start_codon:yes stop_codon:yes gene_type:complete